MFSWFLLRERMHPPLSQLKYQKSVDSHTPSRLQTSWRANGSLCVESDETTGDLRVELQTTTSGTLLSSLLVWVYKQHLCMDTCAIYKTKPNQQIVASNERGIYKAVRQHSASKK
jgi:hypothetical protein